MNSLWEHQTAMLEWLNQRVNVGLNHAALFAEMRTGKTRVAVEFAKQQGYKRILVLCPKKTNLVWAEHFNEFAPEYIVDDLTNGRLIERAEKIKFPMLAIGNGKLFGYTVQLLNYDALNSNSVSSAIYSQKWDCVVADEVHRLKMPTGKRSKIAARIQAKFKLALTGTPYHNRPLDVFGIHRFLSNINGYKSTLFGTWTEFKHHYATWYGPNGYILGRYINQDELAQKVDTFAYQVKSKDVLDLPQQLHISYPVQLEDDVLQAYKKLEKENVVKLDQGTIATDNALVNILRLQQMLGGYAIFDNGEKTPISTAKAEALLEIIEDTEPQPIVIFYRFTTDLEQIQQFIGSEDENVYQLNGKYNQLQEWLDCDEGILLVQISAGAEGIDLSKAKYCIYYSKDYSLGTYQQSLARFLKHDTKDQITYIHLIVPNAVDEDINYQLNRKQSDVKSLEQRIRNRYANR
jgi:SNF2 family DNA or RNA helicase